jgi:hypothetical protein
MKKLIALALNLTLIFVFRCGDKNEYFYNPTPVSQPEAIITPNTKIISKDVLGKNLVAKDSTSLIFKQGNPTIDQLKINDVVVSDSGNGLLRKIVKVENISDQIRLETVKAALTEAFEKCRIDYKKPITADMIKNVWLPNGITLDPLKKSLLKPEQIEFTFKFAEIKFPNEHAKPYCELSGQVSFTADIEFYLDIDDSGLKELKWGIKGAINPQIDYSGFNVDIPKQKYLLSKIQLNPITIFVPTLIGIPMPVVITPELRCYICLDATISVGIKGSISCETGLRGGIHYVNSKVGFYLDPIFEPSFEWAQPSGGATIKIYPENQFDLFLYGIAGPSLILKPFVEFDYDYFSEPSAELSVGFEGGGGIYLHILDKTLIEYKDDEFWKLKWKIWSNPTITKIEPESLKIGDELTISGLAFGAGGIFQGNSNVSFNGIKATNYERWENEKIIVQVPENAKSGKLTVFVPIYIPINPPIILLPIVLNNGPLIPSNQIDYYINNNNPTNGSIAGNVTDGSNNNPISGAIITTQPQTSTVTSDASGNYAIDNVSPGPYTVTASKSGYNDDSVTVTIQAGSMEVANIQLSKAGTIPNQGLVAYYPFNGNAHDESGNGNSGNVQGATLTTDRFDNPNCAYYFNGNNNLINCGHGNSLQLNNATTISAWFNSISSSVLGRYIIGKCDYTSPSYEFLICFDYSEGVSGYGLKSCIGGLGFDELGTNFIPDANTWYNVAVTWEYPGSFKLYLNGTLIKNKLSTSLIEPTNQDMIIGCIRPSGEPQMRYFYGKLDDIRIYNRTLTESEIQQLYHEGGW